MMEFKYMTEIDRKLTLQSGKPFLVNGIEIPPLTLNEIIDIGFYNYNIQLEFITCDTPTFAEMVKGFLGKEYTLFYKLISKKEDYQGINPLEFITLIKDDEVALTYLECFKLLLKNDSLEMIKDDYYWIKGENKEGKLFAISPNNLKEIVKALKYQHCINKASDEDKYNPVNDKAREIMEKLKKGKKTIEKIKNKENDEEGLDWTDIIASVASKHPSINYFNIFNLTPYQLLEAFDKLLAIDNYDKAFSSVVMAGGNLDVNHWTKSKNKDD